MRNRHKVDVVICCYNSENVIGKTLDGLLNQKIDNGLINIIVVDNASTDSTIIKVKNTLEHQSKVEFAIVSEEKPGIMNARIKGVENADSDFLIFVDDDNILDENWVQACCNLFEKHTNVGCIGGYNNPLIHIPAPDWFSDYYPTYACGGQAPTAGIVSKSRMVLFGAGLAFRTSLIKEILVNGSEMLLSGRTANKLSRGDDSEICMRCVLSGWELYYDPQLTLHHNLQSERISWDYVLKTRFGGGVASLILDIYSDVIKGRKPKTYRQALISVTKNSFKNIINILLIPYRAEGDRRSFNAAFLKGRIYGLLYYGPKYYIYATKCITRST